MIFRDFFDCIGIPTQIGVYEENFNEFTIEYSFSSISMPSEENFENLFSNIKNSDTCFVYFSIDQGDPVVIQNDKNYYQPLEDIKNLLSSHESGEIITVKINTYKSHHNNQFYFYSKECFCNYIKSFDSLSLANFFSSGNFNHNSKIYISIDEFEGFLNSNKFFISYNSKIEDIDIEYREKRLNNIISSNHSSFFGKLRVLPEDFIFNGDGIIEDATLEIFERLAKILIISSIFDITDLSQEYFYYKLNGYKSLSESISTHTITTKNLNDFYNVYLWVYNSGSIVDKIGLARNLISLHLKKNSSLELEGDVFESLKSSYKIYEKQNVRQYIEVRNKMTDQILDYNKRASTITDNFANGFQRSALSLVTFFSSLIVTKVLATQKNNFDFILYSTLITFVFIGITLIYMFISRAELKQQRKRFIKSYKDFKTRYTDLLTVNDIARILNNDEEHSSDLQFINQKMNWYTNLWIAVLVLVFIATIIYYFVGHSFFNFAEQNGSAKFI